MTKVEELKLLEKISALIESAGADSYIAMTFAGVPEVCRGNIENDFGNCPVKDLETEREKSAEVARIAMDFSEEKDALSDDFEGMKKAYRDAVNAIRAAVQYVHAAAYQARNAADALPADAGDAEICDAFRSLKKAQEAERNCTAVLDASYRKPLCYAMER